MAFQPFINSSLKTLVENCEEKASRVVCTETESTWYMVTSQEKVLNG